MLARTMDDRMSSMTKNMSDVGADILSAREGGIYENIERHPSWRKIKSNKNTR